MEWMLQVVDELDDAISTARLYCLGLIAEVGLLVAGSLGLAAISAALASGAEMTLLSSAALMLGVASILKFHALRSPADR
jgi:hypothetical protein